MCMRVYMCSCFCWLANAFVCVFVCECLCLWQQEKWHVVMPPGDQVGMIPLNSKKMKNPRWIHQFPETSPSPLLPARINGGATAQQWLTVCRHQRSSSGRELHPISLCLNLPQFADSHAHKRCTIAHVCGFSHTHAYRYTYTHTITPFHPL